MAVIQGRQLEPDHGNVRLHRCCRGRVRRTVPTFSDPMPVVSSTRPPSINMALISSTSRLLSDYSSLCWRRSLPSVASTQFCCSPTPSDIGAKVSKSFVEKEQLVTCQRYFSSGVFFKQLGEFYSSTKLHRVPWSGPAYAPTPPPSSSNIVSFSALPRATSSTYLTPQMLQKNVVHQQKRKDASGLEQTRDIVIFNMKRKRYSVVSLYS